jgi:hypothetical protein
MPQLTFLSQCSASRKAPADLSSSACLHIYDGFPDPQDWAHDALTHAKVSAAPRALEQTVKWTSLEAGDPVGSFIDESYRVARAFGLVTNEAPSTGADAPLPIFGAGLAQGLCYATWRQGPQGAALVVSFEAPAAFGWGAAKSNLSLEHLKAQCLRQYARQAQSLLANVGDLDSAYAVQTEFLGTWGPETERIRQTLTGVCVLPRANEANTVGTTH